MKKIFFYPHHSGVVCSKSKELIPVVSFTPKITGSLSNLKNNLHVCTPNPGNLIHSESPSRIFDCNFDESSKGNLTRLIKQFDNIKGAANYINTNYQCMVLSFANDLRVNWESPDHKLFAELFYLLEIKIFIFGLGMQDEIVGGFERLSSNLHDFVCSIRDNAEFVGVRGESTGRWLIENGFKNSIVLGCPSIFRKPKNVLRAIDKSADKVYKNIMTAGYIHSRPRHLALYSLFNREDINSSYIFQNDLFSVFNKDNISEDLSFYDVETQTVNLGLVKSRLKEIHKVEQPFKRYCFFTNTNSWFMYNSMQDLFIGDRLHAAISALLSGIPTILIYSDLRVKEIAEFYAIPSISIEEIEDSTIEIIIEEKFNKDALDKFKSTYLNRLKDFYNVCSSHGLNFIMDEEINELI